MQRPRKTIRPTPGEMEVLGVMWKIGRAPTQRIHEECSKVRETALSTVATLIRLMVAKGFVRKFEDDARRHEFEAIITHEQAGRSAVKDLRERLFGGSLRRLVSHAFSGKKPSAEELDELAKLIREARDEK